MSSDPRQSRAGKGYGYRELSVWQKGMDLAKRVYGITRTFPSEEKFGLVSQMRRAAVSVPSTQLRLGIELGFCANGETAEIGTLVEEIRKMLNGLRRNLSARER